MVTSVIVKYLYIVRPKIPELSNDLYNFDNDYFEHGSVFIIKIIISAVRKMLLLFYRVRPMYIICV